MLNRRRPHNEDELEDAFLEEDEGWWRVKTATPAVTSATTRYL